MLLRSSTVEPGLTQKGFIVEQGKDLMYRHFYQGKRTGCWTKISHGANHDISDSLVGLMKKQLKLQTARQVRELCECTLSGERYIEILREQ